MNTKFPHTDDRGHLINYYDVLNLPYDAKKEDIRTSFCSLIKLYHPDISGKDTVDMRIKADLIIRGYKTLIDENLRMEYDRNLFSTQKFSVEGYAIIPVKRIKYSMSLGELLKIRLLNKKIRHKDRIRNLGQDVEIFITPGESRRGILTYIDLPSRIACPLCYGKSPECHICRGVGRIGSTSTLAVTMPPPIEHGRMMDFDLMKARPDRFTSFAMKTLRIKVSIIGMAKSIR